MWAFHPYPQTLTRSSHYVLVYLTNTSAAKANYYLGVNNDRLQKSIRNLASGTRLSSPVEDPGSLAVSMKLNASINRLSGAMSNVQNGVSFLEVQDGILDTVGKIIDRMSELKGLASQDPMKNELDRNTYNNEFKDLQMQLYDISQMTFNGVSLSQTIPPRVVKRYSITGWTNHYSGTIP